MEAPSSPSTQVVGEKNDDSFEPAVLDEIDDPEKLRRLGNAAFLRRLYPEALACYDRAVEGLMEEDGPKLAVVLCNRSACHLRMGGNFVEKAKEDAREALSLTKFQSLKAYFRLAKAYVADEEWENAASTIQKALGKVSSSGKSEEAVEFRKLLASVEARRSNQNNNAPDELGLPAKVSIRDFVREGVLGEGNFSTVVACTHVSTGRKYALKVISKREAERLAKRQHPNVWNEIAMERRVLCERLSPHPGVVACHRSFQTYEELYLLMNLYCSSSSERAGDLWSTYFYGGAMVGPHFSTIPWLLRQILAGLEHLHKHGIVHRDLKPENVLLEERTGRPVLIDFGTAKDLIVTDKNGPEFVGTPDFMAPEAVASEPPAGPELDLWCLGAMAYQMHLGQTPFHSSSHYATFLRIAHAHPRRRLGLVHDDDAWDFCASLLKQNPQQRLGAGTFVLSEDENPSKMKCITPSGTYEALRDHPFLKDEASSRKETETMPLPTLVDLCVRVATDAVVADSERLEDTESTNKSAQILVTLSNTYPDLRDRIMHALDRRHILQKPRIFKKFFDAKKQKPDARIFSKLRPRSYDYVGLTLEDFPLQEQQERMEERERSDKPLPPDETAFVVWIDPLFLNNYSQSDKEPEKAELERLKDGIRKINKIRPKVVVVLGRSGAFRRTNVNDDNQNHNQTSYTAVTKLLAKINESIHVVLFEEGLYCFDIHLSRSTQALFLTTSTSSQAQSQNNDKIPEQSRERQNQWLQEELEQYRMSRNQLFCFVDRDPRSLDDETKQSLAKSHVKCVYGTGMGVDTDTDTSYRHEYRLEASSPKDNDNGDEDEEDDHEACSMVLRGGTHLMERIAVDETTSEWKAIDMLPPSNPES